MRCLTLLISGLILRSSVPAQFVDNFDGDSLTRDPRGIVGWTFFTGDGSATMEFSPSGTGYASIAVDATKDIRGIWWALIRRRVSERMNLGLLNKPGYALRIESRIKVSDAPRRVNLHLNTQRTTDFHTHLMEFDIPDATRWHTISMTTHQFDAVPGDTVYGQLALMDWGPDRYRVDLDYFRVDVVNVDSAGPDKGVQVPYHPPVRRPGDFLHHVPVAHDGTIDLEYRDSTFNNWSGRDQSGYTTLLTTSGTQIVLLRWNLEPFSRTKIAGSGLLELTTYALQRSRGTYKDYGMVRITEIIGGDPAWTRERVTFNNLCRGQPLKNVFNPQMIIDVEVAEEREGRTLATIPEPVLQRIIDGTTPGLAIRPLGAIHASFYAMENDHGRQSAMLHFNIASDSLTPAPPRY